MEQTPLLQVEHLKKYYPVKGGLITHTVGHVHAVDDVSFTLNEGETLGLVGEACCGKSTVGRHIVWLETPTSCRVLYNGRDLNALSAKELAGVRTQLQMVFQDSFSSLNPRKHISEILSAPMLYHGLADKGNVDQKVDRLLELVGLPKNAKNRYQHEFSGGQRQRIGIARALSLEPRLIVCDEPVSALDVSIQAQILNLFCDLQQELGLTYLFIGHGLAAVNYVSDRIAVMYLGQLVEIADAAELFAHPAHPYTQALCDAAPVPDPDDRGRKGILLKGVIGSASDPPAGCRLAPRCPFATDACRAAQPPLVPVAPGSTHLAACPVAVQQQKEGA